MFVNNKTIPNIDYSVKLREFKDQALNDMTKFWDQNYIGHMNFDISMPHYEALKYCIMYNQNNVAIESSKFTTKCENKFITFMKELVGYDEKAWGYVTLGGTISNIEALWIAREKARYNKNNADVVFVSSRSHYSIKKACNILGLKYREISFDAESKDVNNIDEPNLLAVFVTLGTTEEGYVENLKQCLLRKAQNPSLFIACDCAFGGYFCFVKSILSEYVKEQFELLSLADSITIDQHKMGFCPYNGGCFLLKNGDDKKYVDSCSDVKYITSQMSSFTIEGSRSGALIAASYFGHDVLLKEYPRLIKDIYDSAVAFEALLKKDFDVYTPRHLNIILFTLKEQENTYNKSLMDYFISCFCRNENIKNSRIQLVTTEIKGIKYFRCVIMDPSFINYYDKFYSKLISEFKEYYRSLEKSAFKKYLPEFQF